jgi:hypothetical protein
LKQYDQAEDYLSLAKWAVMKAPYCAHKFKAQLHRNFGLLYSAQGNYDDALYHLANDVSEDTLDTISESKEAKTDKLIPELGLLFMFDIRLRAYHSHGWLLSPGECVS